MPVLTKRSPRFRLEFVANKSHSVHGELPAEEALCQQFGLWDKLRQVPGLDSRKRKTQGYSPQLWLEPKAGRPSGQEPPSFSKTAADRSGVFVCCDKHHQNDPTATFQRNCNSAQAILTHSENQPQSHPSKIPPQEPYRITR
jgi:hypothetical protein